MEIFPGPKMKTNTTANKKRNSSAVKNLSGSLKIIFTLSRSAVRYATESKIISGMEIKREQKPARSSKPPKHSVAPAGKSAIEELLNGTVHVCQSAPSQGFGPLEKGQAPPAVHFAQINEKDGFFLTASQPDPDRYEDVVAAPPDAV